MVDRNIIRELDIDEKEIEEALEQALGGPADEQMLEKTVEQTISNFQPGAILKGKIIEMAGGYVVVDVGLKSEGLVALNEFGEPDSLEPGDEIEVLLESVDDGNGLVVLSKRKADRIRGWERIVANCKEGDDVTGKVMRKIKGGLLVDIGVPVFLPASQVDIRRPGDIGEFVGQTLEAKILKIDTARRNVVISRRKLLEEAREEAKAKLFADIEIDQVRKGVVKNIADFGVFVDLGGLDGLLHITDMSWERIGHPSETVRLDQELEVKILNIDKEKEKIALGLKQLTENPWERIEEKYPNNSKVTGEVVNITNYGAFVKLEPGVEGLVHISQMSWTKRINHPTEVVSLGQMVDIVVLGSNKDKQEISLGIKQTQVNPWEVVAQKYPPNTIVEGVVRNLTSYGAFIELQEGVDGLLHISDMSWTKKIIHPSEMIKKGEKTKCVVLSVDKDKMRVALGLKQLKEDPWLHEVPSRYIPGQIVKGVVTKITSFGLFLELEPGLEGLLHISELADHKVEDLQQEVKVGDEIEVKILRVDARERKIGLSKKRAEWASEEASGERQQPAGPDEAVKERRGGLEGSGELFGSLKDVAVSLRETDQGQGLDEKKDEPKPDEDTTADKSDQVQQDQPVDESAAQSDQDVQDQADPDPATPED